MRLPSILLTNLRSINNKFDDFSAHVYSLHPDVLICTETWLSSNIPDEALCVSGYRCHRTDRLDDRGHGGVAIWTKNCFRSIKLSFPTYEMIEVCIVHLPIEQLIVVGLYLPPGINCSLFHNFCESFIKSLDEILIDLNQCKLIVAGDFNR